MILLITGCRSGIGLVTAIRAARAGHTVYAGLRDLSTADEQLAPALAALPEGSVRPIQLDVTDPAQRSAAIEQILSEQGRLDGLVNNAGIAIGGFLEDVEEDELRRVFEVNVFALWALTRAVLPQMRAQGEGAIVNVSSMSGRMAFPALGTYASSKFAIEGMSEAWRHELRPFGIRVILVEPGAYRTDIWSRNRQISRRSAAPGSPYADMFEQMNARFEQIVDKQAGDPEEVAAAIVRLLEDPRPPLRTPLGADARLRTRLSRYAPFGLIEYAVAKIFRG